MGEVKERPILFSGPMVRAILEGRKTQTRRIRRAPTGRQGESAILCPYGAPGDLLWVRETWAPIADTPRNGPIVFRSDGERGAWIGDGGGGSVWIHHGWTLGVSQHRRDGRWFSPPPRWSPAIHMPRWASRLRLVVREVRVERVQDISEADARAEGLKLAGPRCDLSGKVLDDAPMYYGGGSLWSDPVRAFEAIWDAINGKRAPWSSNPWVWVVSFTRIDP